MYKEAIHLCPTDEKDHLATLHNNLGIIYNKQGEKLMAKGEFSSAIKFNPKYSKSLWHRMNIFKAEEEYDAAVADAKAILEHDPEFAKK